MTGNLDFLNKKSLLLVIIAITLICLTNIDNLSLTLDGKVSTDSHREARAAAGKSGTGVYVQGRDDDESDGEDADDVDDGDEREEEPINSNVACYKSPMLPKRMYSVIGHESSGTQFTTGIIRDALDLPMYREGSAPYPKTIAKGAVGGPLQYVMEEEPIQAQHFSLPWGSTCTNSPNPPIVDVVLPPQCTRMHMSDNEEVKRCCNEMTTELLGTRFSSKLKMPVKYPVRYNLDIVSHKEWWDAHGVDQWIIIVLRDQDISATARNKGHCSSVRLMEEEEETAKAIIIDAINKYILDKDEKKVTSETYNYWHSERFVKNREDIRRRRLAGQEDEQDDIDAMTTTLIPSKNNIVLVSYESMMHLGEVYVEMLYKTLGIETDYMPTFKNGNAKYVPGSPYRGANGRKIQGKVNTQYLPRSSIRASDFNKRFPNGV